MHFCAGVFVSHLDADLARAGWSGEITPYPGITLGDFRLMHLRRAILKKYVNNVQGTTREGDAKALKKFIQANERCRSWRPETAELNEAETEVVGEVKAILHDFFNPKGLPLLTLGSISQGFNVGPGASIGAKGQDFYTKFSTSNFSATSTALYDLYRAAIGVRGLWHDQELSRASVRGIRLTQGNKLSFVPKYSDVSRVICTEPLLNMIFQKGVEKTLVSRLRQVFGIDLASQQLINRRLARVGARTGLFATLDLESASDSISVELCKFLLPPEVWRWLNLIRSPQTVLPDGSQVELHMVSSMGNATTFPLQTLIFAAIVLACYRVYDLRIKKRASRSRFTPSFTYYRDYSRSLPNFAVNGDDIIVLSKTYRMVRKMLTWFGFVVNEEKSFSEGSFRESCGADFYGATNVRGVYLKHINDVCDVSSAINRLNRWSARHGVWLPQAVGYLRGLCGEIPYVPADEPDTSGLKVPLHVARPRRNRNGSFEYRAWVILTRQISLDRQASEIKKALPSYFQNDAGLLNALLAGAIRDSLILQRPKRRRLSKRRRVTPRWEFHDDSGDASPLPYGRWETAVTLNLMLQG